MSKNLVKRSRFTGYKGMARIGREANARIKEAKAAAREETAGPELSVGDICEDLVKGREVEVVKLPDALTGRQDEVRVQIVWQNAQDRYNNGEYWQKKENLKLKITGKNLEFIRILNSIEENMGKDDDVSVWRLAEHKKRLKAFIDANPEYKEKVNEIFEEMENEKLPGGLAQGKTIEDIAKMHGVDLGYANEQLAAGIKVEMEHTNDENVAAEVARDHLVESIHYYEELAKMEKKLEGEPAAEPEAAAEESLIKQYESLGIVHLHIEEDHYFIEGCRFPKMNKNDTLEEYEEQLDDPNEYYVETVDVKKIVAVNSEKWDEITGSLLTGREDLWEKIGGHYLNDDIAKNHGLDTGDQAADQAAFEKWIGDEKNLKLYQENNYAAGVALYNKDTDEACIINTETYPYARYVGFPDEFSGKIVIANYVNAKIFGTFEGEPIGKDKPEGEVEFDSELEKINHIRGIIDKNGADILKYSAKELALLDTYEGMGGQAKKVEKGTHDVGILDQFYTPYQAIEKMWGLALKHGFKFTPGKKILETSCGIGRFFEYVPKFCAAVGYEIDKYAATISKLKFPNFAIIGESFESIFFDKMKRYVMPESDFDLVIGNPPYREFHSKWAVIEDSLKENEKTRTLAQTYDQYFMMRGVDLLKSGGLLVFIVPNTFLSNDNKYNDFKNKLNQKAELIDAYRLPNKIFYNTDISTDIIVLKKR